MKENPEGTGNLNATYLVHRTNTSSSVTSFFGEKDGNDFTFRKTVVITKTTQTAAKTPFPVLGILAGLGIAGVLVMRRR